MTDKRFNHVKAEILMSEDRKKRLPPDEVIDYLQVTKDDCVADLGAGNGYFAIPMAKRTNGTVYAVDIEPKMLEMLKKNADGEHLENLDYVESDLDKIQLNDDSVNKVMIAFVLHEVPNIDKTLREIKRILKPGGQMLLLEWEAIQTESGPPVDHRISSEKMTQVIEENGFDAELIPLNQANYAIKALPNEN